MKNSFVRPPDFVMLMERKRSIYTYGDLQLVATAFIRLLEPHGINCVVDCRPVGSIPAGGSTSVDELKGALHHAGIAYLPFSMHFGAFPPSVCNKRGGIIYRKAVESEQFLRGIERLNNGIEKGYRICILDDQPDTYRSKRCCLIGRYLKGTHEVLHLSPNGRTLSQELAEEGFAAHEANRRQKRRTAYALGYTGEELAALYLMKNGYRILDHNWNLHKGFEIDLVAMKGNRLHFIEVKTRTSAACGEPQTAIDRTKMKHIAKSIQAYRHEHHLAEADYQIDSIAITYQSETDYTLKHFPDIRPYY